MIKALLLSISALLAGCSLFGKKEKLEDWGSPTPAGYRVEWKDQGTVAGGTYSQLEIFQMFDEAIARAQKYLVDKYQADVGTTALYARSTRYYLVDDKRIATNVSGTGFATGITYESNIQICLLSRKEAPPGEAIPTNAAPWTIVDLGGGRRSYGIIDTARPFPALGHELGHRLYGPGFEH